MRWPPLRRARARAVEAGVAPVEVVLATLIGLTRTAASATVIGGCDRSLTIGRALARASSRISAMARAGVGTEPEIYIAWDAEPGQRLWRRVGDSWWRCRRRTHFASRVAT